MSDDIDDLLRRAMKTLDDQVPPGYFENFTIQTLSRLEDSSMQTDDRLRSVGSTDGGVSGVGTGTEAAENATPAAPQVAAGTAKTTAASSSSLPKREEDSGLHDIRNLASSQRMRISSKRTSQSSIKTDDDLLASASSSWKAVALPEPAKMISLPELAELPPADEVRDLDRAHRDATSSKSSSKSADSAKDDPRPAASSNPAVGAKAAAAVEPSVTPIATARGKAVSAPAAKKAGNKNAMVAVIGIGVAAAAGVAIFVSTRGKGAEAPPAATASSDAARGKAGVELQPLRTVEPRPAPAVTPIEEPPAAVAAAPAPPAPPPPPEAAADKGKAAAPAPTKPSSKGIGKIVPNVVEEKPEPKKEPAEAAKKPAAPGDPDFDKLLKEAGYQEKQAEAPKLEKKSLSGDDIKKGMNGVAAKASACYDGQQGSAAVKLTVAPSGQIQKVTVTGQFAGTPVGACVEAAVRSASFPAWDGGPQSISYSYLLSE